MGAAAAAPGLVLSFISMNLGGGGVLYLPFFFLVGQKSGTVWATPGGVWLFFDGRWAPTHAAEVF